MDMIGGAEILTQRMRRQFARGDRVLSLKVGDRVTRMLAGTVPMEMLVVAVDDKFLYCTAGGPGPDNFDPETDEWPGWKFDKTFGYEVDEDLGWGVDLSGDGKIMTGSYLTQKEEATT